MEIAVHPDGTVVVKAPIDSDVLQIDQKIYKRARWILKQIIYFRQFTPKTPERCYVNGETHLYLGKQYRLKTVQGDQNCVKLNRGFFIVTCREKDSPENIRKLLQKWYSEKAVLQFNNSMKRCWPKVQDFADTKPTISVKRMKKRWGSLSDKGTVILNVDLVKAPKECIDYVLIHELCHLKYNNHGREFYTLLDSITPGWKKIKHKLELSLI
jgi:hypothetical protein